MKWTDKAIKRIRKNLLKEMLKFKCKNCKKDFREDKSHFCKKCGVQSDYIEIYVDDKDIEPDLVYLKDLYMECLEILSNIKLHKAKQKYAGIKLI